MTVRARPAAAAWVLVVGVMATRTVPATAGTRPAPDREDVEHLFDEWRFSDAQAALATFAAHKPAAASLRYLQGYQSFLAGDYLSAGTHLRAALALDPHDRDAGALVKLVDAAADAIKGHSEKRSQHFILRYPSEDAVIADYALETLEAALSALREDLGFTAQVPIPVDIYRNPQDLAAVSTLTVEEVERTSTIALCKWARLMATTPRALRYGYPWLDSLNHELVHYVVSSLSDDRAPVWLQEGLAKFLERRWREPAGGPLPPSMQHLLAKALGSGKLISFEAMHPSMAKLPRAEDAGLAFAEVATTIAYLHQRGGMAALRSAIANVAAGMDARIAVAQAAGAPWPGFEKGWHGYMTAQKFHTFPGFEPVTRQFRKPTAIASKRAPTEDEDTTGMAQAQRYLRVGNMLLLRRRPQAAATEYEKGAKLTTLGHWIFPVKLGRTYLAMGRPDEALQAVSEAKSLYPELPWPTLIAGQALLAKGDAQGAVTALLASLATNPFDPAVHCALAQAYERLADTATPVKGGLDLPDHRARARRDCDELSK